MTSVRGDLEFDAQTDKGMVRSENQDRTGVWVDESDGGAARGRLFVVCDGMGGHNGGSVASATAVEALLAGFRESPESTLRRRLGHAIEVANTAVRRKAAQDLALRNMGTTCVALVLRGRRAQIAHIGDSRAYLFRGGKVEQITRDHTYLNDLIGMGLITPERARNHPERNIITRCIGMGDALQIDFNTREIRKDDIFLLCTDGLYNYVEGEEMRNVAESKPPSEACETLVRLANSRGGEDNITCLVVRVNAVAQDLADDPADETTAAVSRPLTPLPDAVPAGASSTGTYGQFPGTDVTEIRPSVEFRGEAWWRGWTLVNILLLVLVSILIVLTVVL